MTRKGFTPKGTIYDFYKEEKFYKYMPTQSGESQCCGAAVIDDYELCSDCKEHCDRMDYDE
jgi:hypothetical protein